MAETNNSNGSSFFRSSVPLLIFFCSCFILFFLWLKYNKRTLYGALSTYTVHQRVLRAIASECNSFSKFCNVFHPQPFYSRVSLYIDIQIKLTVILQALKHNLYLRPHHPPPSPPSTLTLYFTLSSWLTLCVSMIPRALLDGASAPSRVDLAGFDSPILQVGAWV